MDKAQKRDFIARRAAKELKDGYVINLGIGIPTLCAKYLDPNISISINAEPGILGQGLTPAPEDADPFHVVDASGRPASVAPGGSFTDSATNFGLIRGGHIDATVLGCLQCDEEGNISNWIIPGVKMPGMGGAMDLCTGAKTVIVAMEHTARGEPKIMKKCTLPLTAAKCVKMIITDMAVMRVIQGKGIVLEEYNPELGSPQEAVKAIRAATDADFTVSPALKPMC